MRWFYYQRINDIGKEVALVSSSEKIDDAQHFRPVTKDYYDEVYKLLQELSQVQTEIVEEEP